MKEKHKWTESDIKELKEIWDKYPIYKLAKYFHTTSEEIKRQEELLGFEVLKSNRWTKEEEELLRKYSSLYLTQEIAEKLGRSYLSVQKKALKLGIELHSEEDPWEDWMINYLMENINKVPIGEISKKLGLSYRRILTKCNKLGIEYIPETWTEEEIETLRKYAKTCHYTELTKVLPRRTVGAISAKAFELGIETISEYTKLSENDIKYIKDNWNIIPATEIARNLKISMGVLNRYKKELGLKNTGQKKKWTKEVIRRLKKDAKTKSRNELAKKYKTSPGQISNIAHKNNIELIDTKKVWNDELDSVLKNLVGENLSVPQIAKKMNIKASTIRTRITNLGLKKKKPKNPNKIWSDEEIRKLIELSEEKTILELIPILNKTSRQITLKAKNLGLKLKKTKEKEWTETDTKTLLSLYENYELHEIAKKMDRTEQIIKEKAKELNIELKIRKRSSWTEEEESLLIEYSKKYDVKEIAKRLNRSSSSISSKLTYMGLSAKISSKFWSNEEIEQLKKLAEEKTVDEISLIMNRTTESILGKLYRLGTKTVVINSNTWTQEEEQTLKRLLMTYSSFEVAELLNRSEESVIVRAKKLGIDLNLQNRPWTQEEEDLLSDLWGNKQIEYISKKLNRTESALINRAFILGLGSQLDNNYDGLRIQEISDILLVDRNTILTSWLSLGLKVKVRKRSNNSTYKYVTIEDLYDFLEQNQNIWDSRNLEKNILGIEPDWLKGKRKNDKDKPLDFFGIERLTKQQLLRSKQYYLDIKEKKEVKKLVKKKED